MTTEIHERHGRAIAEVVADEIIVRDAGEALDVLASAQYHAKTGGIVLHAKDIDPRFFDLTSGMAGEVLQKVSNYGMAVAIVGGFEDVESRALRDFIRESNEYGQVVFVPDVATAVDRLAAGRHGATMDA